MPCGSAAPDWEPGWFAWYAYATINRLPGRVAWLADGSPATVPEWHPNPSRRPCRLQWSSSLRRFFLSLSRLSPWPWLISLYGPSVNEGKVPPGPPMTLGSMCDAWRSQSLWHPVPGLALHLLGNWCGCSHLRQNRRTIVPSCYHPVMVKQKHETGPVMTLGIMPEVQRGANVSRKESA
jgi:hypothetical protein